MIPLKNRKVDFSYKKIFSKIDFKVIMAPIFSVILALLIGAIILIIAKRNPLLAYKALFKGALGNLPFIGDTLCRATPVIFTGLAVAFAFKCGLFNIGVEGQLLMGALAAALVGHYVKGLPIYIHLPLSILAGALVGALWSALAGLLKAWRGVHEVITTIMLNYIAYSLTAFAIERLRDGVTTKTPRVLTSAELKPISNFISGFAGSTLNMGFILALIACWLIYFILKKTVLGYEVKAVGFNPLAAEDGGIKVSKNIIIAMAISGALAGLAGTERALGMHGAFVSGISPGLGFEGIAVALLANNNPFGIILSGILFGGLASGGLYMDMSANVPQDIVLIIQALIVFFAVVNFLARFKKPALFNRKKKEGAA